MTAFEHELAAHAQALAALARLLVGDQHADDLVQETSLQVLHRPPPPAVAPRSWLFAVLRHRAGKLRRGEQRRTAHRRNLDSWPSTRRPPSACTAR
jgi:DNA-directed RNA polymerase specialized sigma24 family protein